MNHNVRIEEINDDSSDEKIEIQDVETEASNNTKTEEGEEVNGAMRVLKVSLEDIKLDDLSEIEAINKHLQVIYDNQRNILTKLGEMKKDNDYNVKWLRDEVNFLNAEYAKMTHNLV
jgi:hypothetical protein